MYFLMHNKEYALKLVQEKLNGLNSYSYSQIANLTGYPLITLHPTKKLSSLKTLKINIQLLV